MRIAFKSVLVLSERKQQVIGGIETTVIYDLQNVGEHVFDEPTWKLRLDPVHLLTTPLLASPILALALYSASALTFGRVWSSPFWLAALILIPLALAYMLSLHGIVWRRMKAQARRERYLAENASIVVIREHEWETFRAKLKQTDDVDQLVLLLDQLAQARRAQQQAPPLPNSHDAMRKWSEQGGEADNCSDITEKLPETRTDIRPENPNA